MTESTTLDVAGEAADLLERAASQHEAAGRAALASRHRRAATALRSVPAPA